MSQSGMSKKPTKKTPKRTKKTPKKDPVHLYNMEIVPYYQTLYWSWAPTPDLFLVEMKRTLPFLVPNMEPLNPDSPAHCEIFNHNGIWYPVIWVSDHNKPWLLAHEVDHFVFWLLDYKGLVRTKESQEAYSYLLQFIMEMMIENRREGRYPKS